MPRHHLLNTLLHYLAKYVFKNRHAEEVIEKQTVMKD